MTNTEGIALSISVLSLVVSTISLVRTRKVAGEQLRLSEMRTKHSEVGAELSAKQLEKMKTEEAERTQAKLNVMLSKLGNTHHFLVTNRGAGSAYNLDFEFFDCEKNAAPEDQFPRQELRSNDQVKLMARLWLGGPQKFNVRLTWEDADGNAHNEEFREIAA